MAHRPKRTFRQRRTDSSDSDGAEEPSAGPRVPGEQAAPGPEEEGPPPGGGRAEAAIRPFRGRGSRGRGRVWASSRRAARAAPRADGGVGAPGDLEQQESRTVDLSTDEEDGPQHATGSKDDPSSSSNSSSTLEEEFSSIVNIPDAAVIRAARRRRGLARAREDYIPLDVTRPSTLSDRKESSAEEPDSEPDDHEQRIPFTPKPQTLKQRMAEETTTRSEETSEESQEDENQDIWEQQQMRKAVKITEGRDIDLSSHSSEFQTVKKFDTTVSFPPVNLEVIKKQLNTRLTLLQDTHRSHLREYEKYIEDVKSSKSAIQNLENLPEQALNIKFYKSMKIYVENLIDCLNEKAKLRHQQMEA
ncbi:intron Large complex component GCFC2 isoform X4 [Artibeus jamaicensis]|uniref:intron Large complex component GCFC2 isoform X4 n=1 Tax=Artibeus jamaicensis TaxID=9417 RepID=UPI00235ADFF2|nr:intron Large complex component GCFC2 isoform X4 [Artibeus jamaicensis]